MLSQYNKNHTTIFQLQCMEKYIAWFINNCEEYSIYNQLWLCNVKISINPQ